MIKLKNDKPSTRMHEVYEISTKCIVHCGSRNSCIAFHDSKTSKKQDDLIVQVATR